MRIQSEGPNAEAEEPPNDLEKELEEHKAEKEKQKQTKNKISTVGVGHKDANGVNDELKEDLEGSEGKMGKEM